MQNLINAFTTLFSKIAAVVQWFADLAKAVFTAAWDLLKDGVCWVFESVLQLVATVIGSVPLEGITQNLAAFGSVPANVLEVLAALGMGTAFGIITAAIGIRLVLQLIPFTRLGS